MGLIHTRTLGHIHFGLLEVEMRNKTGSNGNFHGPMPICGNGSWHAHTTRNPQNITCEKCKALLAENPSYLSKVY
jgi:hypothetical protein